MINLLPEPEQHSLRTTYYARLATVVIALAAFVVCAGAALLAPSYFLARVEADTMRNSLSASTQALASGQGASDTKTMEQISEQVSLMKSFPRTPHIAAALSALTRAVPQGVFISKVAIAPDDSGSDSISIFGIAGTRGELLAFAHTLQSSPSFSGVSVPLSQLAGETDITFSLSFSTVPSHL